MADLLTTPPLCFDALADTTDATLARDSRPTIHGLSPNCPRPLREYPQLGQFGFGPVRPGAACWRLPTLGSGLRPAADAGGRGSAAAFGRRVAPLRSALAASASLRSGPGPPPSPCGDLALDYSAKPLGAGGGGPRWVSPSPPGCPQTQRRAGSQSREKMANSKTPARIDAQDGRLSHGTRAKNQGFVWREYPPPKPLMRWPIDEPGDGRLSTHASKPLMRWPIEVDARRGPAALAAPLMVTVW